MRRMLVPIVLVMAGSMARADDTGGFTRKQDVIYGRKAGLALTLDVFTPKKNANGAAVIAVVSGGWFSNPSGINPLFYQPLLKRGYTVFAVVHGSQPKFTIPEIVEDMHRAVRFIRHNAKDYGIDGDRIGIMGGSAGGHLSLMMGTAGCDGDPKAPDPIDRLSSKVQAVACFFPPTDFLNWGKKGNERIDRGLQPPFTAAVDYHAFDKEKARYFPVTNEKELREISRKVSPAQLVTKDSAPSFIVHGDKDDLVPLQQSEWILEKFKDAGVKAELVVKKGAAHGWLTLLVDIDLFADWFDKHLARK